MSSKATRSLDGFVAIGGEVPFLNPHSIKIVGLDIEQTADNWFAFCPRAKEPLEPEWIADIRKNGARVAIDAYRDGSTTVMLDGRRRVRAGRIIWDEQEAAGVPEKDRISIRVNVRRGSPMELFSYNVGSTNRKELSLSQKAALMLHAQKFSGADESTLAAAFGCTVTTVKYTLKALDLDPSILDAVDTKGFAVREAIKLADMPRAEQKEVYTKLVAAGATKGIKASNGIAHAKRGEKDKIADVDTTRVRSRVLLEKWLDALKKDSKGSGRPLVDAIDLLKFVLGAPIPRGFDAQLKEALAEAGFKSK